MPNSFLERHHHERKTKCGRFFCGQSVEIIPCKNTAELSRRKKTVNGYVDNEENIVNNVFIVLYHGNKQYVLLYDPRDGCRYMFRQTWVRPVKLTYKKFSEL